MCSRNWKIAGKGTISITQFSKIVNMVVKEVKKKIIAEVTVQGMTTTPIIFLLETMHANCIMLLQ